MNYKQVTPAQIEQLYSFTKEHFVKYYDLQTELVDHLANAIETQWEQNPDLNFDEALQTEFKKFGVYGFSDVVKQRQKALSKRYNKLLWGYFKQFFTFPHLLLTAGMLVLTYKLLEYEKVLYVALIVILAFTIIKKIADYKRIYNKKVKDTGKRWLLEEIIFKGGSIAGLIGIPAQCIHFVIRDNTGAVTLWVLSIIFVLSALASYVVLFVIPAKAEEHLAAVYPEYNLENMS
jgi:hypothetical protein